MGEPIPGPDGFLATVDDPLRPAHLRIDEYLLEEEVRHRHGPQIFDIMRWRKLSKRELATQIQAVLHRMTWLYRHDSDLINGHLARLRLTGLLRALYSIKAIYTETELRAFLDLTTPLLGAIQPYGPVESVVAYLQENELTPQLCVSLRHYQANLREEGSVSQASMQSLRQQLHVLLWLDEWEPLDPARCWSECIRRDFRAMIGERRARWRALLKHIRGNAPVRMPSGWARQAEMRLSAVGIEDFRESIHLWFAAFRSGQGLPLSVAGSHVLKGLIWYCAITRDEDLKATCLWLLHVNWKQKRNTDKAMVALGQFGITKEYLLSRKLIKPPPPDPTPRILAKMREGVCLQSAQHIQADPAGEMIIVQGQLHFYRMFRSTGRIERATDNALLVLNWSSIPDQLRLFIGRECDSPQQLDFRAYMLMHDAVFGHYFTAK